MPITLVTGTPGAGKTLYTVKMIIDDLIPSGRRIYHNIAGLKVENENVVFCGDKGPLEWMDFEDGCICIFDEVQRQYPFVNGMSKKLPHIQAYETHRHRGMDFIFVTQGPYLLDRHLFPLIDKHFHLYRPFGLSRSTVLFWSGVNEKPQPAQNRTNALVTNFRFPKRLFGSYKSASVHTVKRRLPWSPILKISAVVALVVFALYYILHKLPNTALFTGTEEMTVEELDIIASDPEKRAVACLTLVSSTPNRLKVFNGSQSMLLDRSLVVVLRGKLFDIRSESLLAYICNTE